MGKDRELGAKNALLWHLPDDLKRFKAITSGHAIIMGRKTFEAIGKPLPQRKNIVITRQPDYKAEGCVVVSSLEAALKTAGEDSEVFIIGGGEIYKLALPVANKMYLTFVDANVPADTFFPKFNENEWRLVREEPHMKDEKHPYSFVFKLYERK